MVGDSLVILTTEVDGTDTAVARLQDVLRVEEGTTLYMVAVGRRSIGRLEHSSGKSMGTLLGERHSARMSASVSRDWRHSLPPIRA